MSIAGTLMKVVLFSAWDTFWRWFGVGLGHALDGLRICHYLPLQFRSVLYTC